MELKILDEKDNKLLSRKEYKIICDFNKQATPKKEQVLKAVSDFLKRDQNLVAVKHIRQNFGAGNALVTVNVYDSVENFNKYEIINKKIKKKKAAAETQAQAQKEEKKAGAK